MKLINQSVEYLSQSQGLEGIYKQIELVGRTCYKSEDKITEGSAKPFVDRLIKSGHLSMLEHGTVYLYFPTDKSYNVAKYIDNCYSIAFGKLEKNKITEGYVTTNLRVLMENNWLDDLKYLCEPTENHSRRITLKFITSIGVSREANRHRSFSIAEQSTRYCNYSKDKFDNSISFVYPAWYKEKKSKGTEVAYLVESWIKAEEHYMDLIEEGWQPQQAREVLPLSTATEVVYTAFEEDWHHFFDLRYRGTTGAPHPNMKEIASMAHALILDKIGKDL